MISSFPQFTPLSEEHRGSINAAAHGLPPYSNFNFISLDAWNVQGACMISQVNGNVVVLLADYLTGKPFFSLMGAKIDASMIEMLLRHAAANSGAVELRWVPEESIRQIATSGSHPGFELREDRDAFDYVLDNDQLVSLEGLPKKRRMVERFTVLHPNRQVRMLDLTTASIADDILDLVEDWRVAKNKGPAEVAMEFGAIQRCLRASYRDELIALGVYLKERLIGFTINELLPQGWSMGHFGKALPAYRGLTDVLEHETAKVMQRLGCKLMNNQEDLGLPSLRAAKLAWQPVRFLKKNTIKLV